MPRQREDQGHRSRRDKKGRSSGATGRDYESLAVSVPIVLDQENERLGDDVEVGGAESLSPRHNVDRQMDASLPEPSPRQSVDRQIDESLSDSRIPVAARVMGADEVELRVREHVSRLLQSERQTAPVAQVVSDEGTNRSSTERRRLLIVGALVLSVVAVVVAIVLGVTLSPDRSEPAEPESTPRNETVSPTVLQTAAPTPTPEELINLLVSESFDGGTALATNGTPQNNAFRWLRNNSKLSSYSRQRRLQRFALATFYYSTNGDNWTNNTFWLDDGDECDRWWQIPGYDVLRCNSIGAVTNVQFTNNNLHGTIPAEMALLSNSLEHVVLRINRLTGPFPSSMNRLTNLNRLHLGRNTLTGVIPSTISHLSRLEHLYLQDNKLTGSIPSAIGNMARLARLFLYNNLLTGTFTCPGPDFIFKCLVLARTKTTQLARRSLNEL